MIAAAGGNLWSSLLDVNDDDDDGSNSQTLVSCHNQKLSRAVIKMHGSGISPWYFCRERVEK